MVLRGAVFRTRQASKPQTDVSKGLELSKRQRQAATLLFPWTPSYMGGGLEASLRVGVVLPFNPQKTHIAVCLIHDSWACGDDNEISHHSLGKKVQRSH